MSNAAQAIAREIAFDITGTRVTLTDGRTGIVQSAYGSGEVVDYFDVLLDEHCRVSHRPDVIGELDAGDVRRISCATCGTDLDEQGRCDAQCVEMLGHQDDRS